MRIILSESSLQEQFCSFYWIKSSGIPFFKWFSTNFFEKKWNQEDLFFSGFFSALNSSADTFFEHSPLQFIEFKDYKVFCEKIRSNDLFILITIKDCPNKLALMLLDKMTKEYNDVEVQIDFTDSPEQNNVEIQFLKFLQEVHKKLQNGDYESYFPNHRISNQVRIDRKEIQDIFPDSPKIMQREISDLESKIRTIGMMTRTIAHTFNNLLSTILGNVSLLKMDSVNKESFESLKDIEESSLRARDITSQLLTLVKNINIASDERMKEQESLSQKRTNKNQERTIIKGKGAILLLDDEKSILNTTKRMLSRLGYRVSRSKTLENALEMYQYSIRKGKKFDAVILDLSELGGSGGFGIDIWKKIDPDISTIISSGYADDPIFNDYRKHGIKAVLKKPYDIVKLSRVLYGVIHPNSN